MEVPLDHYDSGACADPPMDPDYIAVMYDHDAADRVHRAGNQTVTRLLSCQRQVAIQDGVPSVINPLDLDVMFQGTVKHFYMQHKQRASSGYKEQTFSAPLLGETVIGTIDRLSADMKRIVDWKTGSETSHAWGYRKGEKADNVAQMSAYRILIERSQEGAKVEEAIIWHIAQVKKGEVPAWWKARVPEDRAWMSEEEIGAHRPKDGNYTVRELIEQMREHRARLAKGISVEDSIRQMPLAGRKMFGGKGCSYCSVARDCDRIEGIVTI